MKSIGVILLVMSLLFSVIGCSKTKVQKSPEKEILTMATGTTGAAFYIWGAAAANIINDNTEIMDVTAQVSGGGRENATRLATGEVPLALIGASDAWSLYTGQSDLPETKKLRLLYTVNLSSNVLVVNPDAPETSLQDLKGKKVSFSGRGGGAYTRNELTIDALELKFEDYDALFLSPAESADAFKEGSIYAFITGAGHPMPALMDAATKPGGAKFLSFSDEDIAKIREKYPYFSKDIIPAGMYSGINYDVTAIGQYSFLCTTSELSDELAHEIVKILSEEHELMVETTEQANVSTPEITIQEAIIPLHPGAEKYFQEIGVMK
jgi:hypothetical protein